MSDNDRIGRFSISRRFLIESPVNTAEVLWKLRAVVVRAETMFAADKVDYVAISPMFREVAFNEVPPEYKIVVTVNADGGLTVEVIELTPEYLATLPRFSFTGLRDYVESEA